MQTRAKRQGTKGLAETRPRGEVDWLNWCCAPAMLSWRLLIPLLHAPPPAEPGRGANGRDGERRIVRWFAAITEITEHRYFSQESLP